VVVIDLLRCFNGYPQLYRPQRQPRLTHSHDLTASEEQLNFNDAHAPKENALEAFTLVLPKIKYELIKSRHDWDAHEPRMYSRLQGISDEEFTSFDLTKDLVQVRSASTTYGQIVLGKIRIPAVRDAQGEGFVHVRIHDPPNKGTEDVTFHSIFTDEIRENIGDQPSDYRAIQVAEKPLEFFNE
jgi:hypothetical protein